MKSRFFTVIAALILLAIMFLQMTLSTLSDSPTNDEQVHLLAGLSYLYFKDLRVNPEHPPLAKLLSAASVKILYPDFKFPYTKKQFADQTQWLQPIADTMFAQNNATKLLLAARLPFILLTLGFALFIFLFLAKKIGQIPALFVLALTSFEPNLLGYGKLIITDNVVAGFLILAGLFFSLALKEKKHKYWAGFGISFLAALLSKYTAVFFIPIFFLSGVLYLLVNKAYKKIGLYVFSYFFVLLICFIGIWGFYSFFSSPAYLFHTREPYVSLYEKVQPQWVITFLRQNPLPYYYSYGMSYVFAQGYFGQKAFLLDKWGNFNWWWFYPVTFVLKTPLVYLLLFAASLLISFRKRSAIVSLFLFIFIFYLLFTSLSPLAIGMRVILPLTYLMLVVIGLTFSSFIKVKFFMILFIISVTTRLFSYPNYLSHINGLKFFFNKYNMMADTNYDWGQDVKRLADYFEKKGISEIYLAYDAAVKPELYGLKVKPLPKDFENPKPKGFVAVSISARNFPVKVYNEKGQEGGYEHPYAWLDAYPVYQTIGETILIYFLP